MNWERPEPATVWLAIDAYLRRAYAADPPSAVRARLDTLRAAPDAEFYESAVFERDSAADPARLGLRLGNRFYPHMKLVIERAPDGKGHLFRADTHDSHCVPDPQSRDYAPFCQLSEKNQHLGQSIEGAWEEQGLQTFKTYLRADLARRSRGAEGG